MVWSVEERRTRVRYSHPSHMELPIDVTVSGRRRAVRSAEVLNTLFPMAVMTYAVSSASVTGVVRSMSPSEPVWLTEVTVRADPTAVQLRIQGDPPAATSSWAMVCAVPS